MPLARAAGGVDELGRFGSCVEVGIAGAMVEGGGGVEKREVTHSDMCDSRMVSPGGSSMPQTGHSSSSFTARRRRCGGSEVGMFGSVCEVGGVGRCCHGAVRPRGRVQGAGICEVFLALLE